MLISITVLVQAQFGCVNEDKTENKTTNNKQSKTMSYSNINVRPKQAIL